MGTFQPGELYVLGENVPHIFRNSVPPKSGAEAEVLHLFNSAALNLIGSIPEFKPLGRLFNCSKKGYFLGGETAECAGEILRTIRLERSHRRRFVRFLELGNLLVESPLYGIESGPGTVMPASRPSSAERIHKVCKVILQKFDEELNHSEMAKLANLAPASFSRLFRAVTRRTFTQFVTEVRIRNATRLLVQTNKTVAEIAFSVGFNNLAHFNRRFRAHHEVSPQEYRAIFQSTSHSKDFYV